jgi:hypothetical protein
MLLEWSDKPLRRIYSWRRAINRSAGYAPGVER